MSTMQAKLAALESGVTASSIFGATHAPEGTGGHTPQSHSGPAPRVSLG